MFWDKKQKIYIISWLYQNILYICSAKINRMVMNQSLLLNAIIIDLLLKSHQE